MANIRIESLHIYPVKSLAGINLQQAELTPLGLKYDRHWMLSLEDGRFVTQRQLPQLATLQTAITADSLIITSNGESRVITLRQPEGVRCLAQVWDDTCEVIDEGDAISQWLTRQAGSPKPLRLVRMATDFQRPQSQPQRFGDAHTRFADAAPLLVTNTASLAALNTALQAKGETPVPMQRFRPNIVINGLPAFAEQQPMTLASATGNFQLQLCDRSSRCIMITIDPATGIKSANQEPFPTLRELNPMPAAPQTPAFGMNATVIKPVEEGDQPVLLSNLDQLLQL